MKIFLKKHWVAFLLAALTGLVIIGPQAYLKLETGKDYRGIYLTGVDAEVYYPRIQEAYNGNLKATSPAVYEYKNEPYAFGPLPEIIMAGLAKALFMNVGQVIVLGNFIFPFLLFLALYFLFLRITGSRIIALVSAAGIILLSNFVFFPKNIWYLFTHPSSITQNPYNRPVHPQISSVFFFFWLLLFWTLIDKGKERYVWFSGLVFGLLFYIYPFAWIFAVVLQGILFLYFIFRKNYKVCRQLLMTAGIGLAVSAFYWINYFHLVANSLYGALEKHLAFYHSRSPLWGNIFFLDFGFLCLLYWYKKMSKPFILLSGIVATGIIVLNQQVITNYRFFPGHWYWYYIIPFSIFLAVYVLFAAIKTSKKLRYSLAAAIIGISLLGGGFSQRNYYLAEKSVAAENQRYGPLFSWLNRNTPKESVVLTPDPLALIMPAYTSNNHYLVDTADVLSIIPEDRYRHDFFVKIYLAGARPDNLDNYINQKTPDFIQLLYGYYRRYEYDCNECYPEEDLTRLKKDYLDFLARDFKSELKKYRIDYMVIDTKTNQWNYQKLNFLEPVAKVNEFTIFKII